MVIRNKKSTHTQEVTQEGWDKIVKAGWKDRFTIVDGGPGEQVKTPVPVPPEIANFAKPIGKQQKADQQKTQQPATDQNSTQGADENKTQS